MTRRAIAFANFLIGLIAVAELPGCNTAGPLSIAEGRLRYNDVIEHTAQKQLLLNLVRVSKNQAPVFIDVTEVDASLSMSGALSSSLIGIGIDKKGGAFRVGSITSGTVTPTVAYSESPTIRFIPLQGQALVQQLAAAISVDSLPPLFDSDVPLPTMIDFAVDRLTPGYYDYGAALNLIGQLDWETAITIATVAPRGEDAANPSAEAAGKNSVIVQTVPPVPPPHTALAIYLQPYGLSCHDTLFVARLWTQLLGLYSAVRTNAENANRDALETLLTRIEGCEGDRLVMRQPGAHATKQTLLAALEKVPSIELRTQPLKTSADPRAANHVNNPAPFLRMRSAYAILRSIEVSDYNPAELIEIVKPQDEVTIADMPWNDGQQFHIFTFQQYCRLGQEINASKCRQMRAIYESLSVPVRDAMERTICQRGAHIMSLAAANPKDDRVQGKLRLWRQVCGRFSFTPPTAEAPTETPTPVLTMGEDDTSRETTLTPERLSEEELLRLQRRYILVVSAPTLPPDTFVSIEVDGNAYYIAKDDVVSQRNFRLLAMISLIQAVTPVPPLTPTLGVGSH